MSTTNDVMDELREAAKLGGKSSQEQAARKARTSGGESDKHAEEASASSEQALGAALKGAPAEALISMIGSLMARIDRLEGGPAPAKLKLPEPVGPPPPPRSERPHIMAYIKPDSAVRIEVTEEYIREKRPGWDGTPVKAYANHDNTVLRRSY